MALSCNLMRGQVSLVKNRLVLGKVVSLIPCFLQATIFNDRQTAIQQVDTFFGDMNVYILIISSSFCRERKELVSTCPSYSLLSFSLLRPKIYEYSAEGPFQYFPLKVTSEKRQRRGFCFVLFCCLVTFSKQKIQLYCDIFIVNLNCAILCNQISYVRGPEGVKS